MLPMKLKERRMERILSEKFSLLPSYASELFLNACKLNTQEERLSSLPATFLLNFLPCHSCSPLIGTSLPWLLLMEEKDGCKEFYSFLMQKRQNCSKQDNSAFYSRRKITAFYRTISSTRFHSFSSSSLSLLFLFSSPQIKRHTRTK